MGLSINLSDPVRVQLPGVIDNAAVRNRNPVPFGPRSKVPEVLSLIDFKYRCRYWVSSASEMFLTEMLPFDKNSRINALLLSLFDPGIDISV